jgi:hypothetical protein
MYNAVFILETDVWCYCGTWGLASAGVEGEGVPGVDEGESLSEGKRGEGAAFLNWGIESRYYKSKGAVVVVLRVWWWAPRRI